MIGSELERGTYVEPTKITVREWINTWLNDYKKIEVRPTTWESYEALARVHIIPTIGCLALQDLRSEHLQHLYNEKLKDGLSPRTVKYIHQIIHSALQQALKNQIILRNVSEATSLPAQKSRQVRALTAEEENRFIAVLQQGRLGAAFLCLLGTGLRRGELLALRWKDINLKNGLLRVQEGLVDIKGELLRQPPKTSKSERIVPLPPVLQEALRFHQERMLAEGNYADNNPIFCTNKGTPIHPRNLNRKFYQLREKAGLPRDVNHHALRHTFATRMLEMGEDLKVVQELLGHSHISITADTYTHVSPRLKNNAAKKMDCHLRTFVTKMSPKKGSNESLEP